MPVFKIKKITKKIGTLYGAICTDGTYPDMGIAGNTVEHVKAEVHGAVNLMNVVMPGFDPSYVAPVGEIVFDESELDESDRTTTETKP